VAAQGEDAGGAGDVPAHAGEFGALADHGAAAGLDRAGADEQPALAEVGVAHPVPVGVEVGQRLVDVLDGGVGCSRAWVLRDAVVGMGGDLAAGTV
jgi:hypothetical protein